MPQLSDVCLCYLLDNTCLRTLWDILAIAEPLDEIELIEECLQVGGSIGTTGNRILNNFEEISPKTFFSRLGYLHIDSKTNSLKIRCRYWFADRMMIIMQFAHLYRLCRNSLMKSGQRIVTGILVRTCSCCYWIVRKCT